MSDDLKTPATEIQIAAALADSELEHRLTLRRLAYERDRLKAEVEALREVLTQARVAVAHHNEKFRCDSLLERIDAVLRGKEAT